MPYFERQPSMESIIREQSWRLAALERNVQEGSVQTTVIVPDYENSKTRVYEWDSTTSLMNNISAKTAKTGKLFSADVSTTDGGFIEVYARVTADAAGSGNSMVMRIDVDGISQGSYLSWSNQSLTEKKTIQGSTVGTSATPAGGFVVIDDALPNTGWNDSTSVEEDSVYTGLVLNEGVHTLDFNMVCTGTGSFGSVLKAVISIRTT